LKVRTISAPDIAHLVKRAIARLAEHPWIATESDAKCALYTNLYSLMAARVHDLRHCGWRIVTEYTLASGLEVDRIDLAVLRNNVPHLMVELKHLTSYSNSQIKNVEDDFNKRRKYLVEPTKIADARLLQVVTSTFNGQHKQLVETRLLSLYDEAGLEASLAEPPAAETIYIKVVNPT
jgi:hypothetical protein